MTPEQKRVRNRAWYAANAEHHKARMRELYAADPQKWRDKTAAYNRTVAGMLTRLRGHAKERNT